MVNEISVNKMAYESMVSYGDRKSMLLDHICSFLLAVAPILQHYKGLYENMGFTVLFVCFPILFLQFLLNYKSGMISMKCMAAGVPIFVFEFYTLIVHSISAMRIFYILFMICMFVFVASGCVNMRLYLKYATAVISCAALIIVVQYIMHYLFRINLNLIPFDLLVSENSMWENNYKQFSTGGSFYRPSAFFLEPSHLFLYCFPVLALLLLSPDMTKSRMKKAVMASAAMVLSTSGFGVAVTFGLWFLYFLFYGNGDTHYEKAIAKIFNAKTMLILIVFLIIVTIAFFTIPVFQRSIVRIFVNDSGSTAIEGRVRLASMYVKQIEGPAVFFGSSSGTEDLEFNVAGFFATYIKWGLLGIAFSYWFYIRGLFKLKKAYFWINAIIIAISFFTAHTHGTFYMMYFFVFLTEGYYQTSEQGNIKYRKVLSPNDSNFAVK